MRIKFNKEYKDLAMQRANSLGTSEPPFDLEDTYEATRRDDGVYEVSVHSKMGELVLGLYKEYVIVL